MRLETRRGSWLRVYERAAFDDHGRFRYYFRGVRVPWILWAMFA